MLPRLQAELLLHMQPPPAPPDLNNFKCDATAAGVVWPTVANIGNNILGLIILVGGVAMILFGGYTVAMAARKQASGGLRGVGFVVLGILLAFVGPGLINVVSKGC